MLLEKKSIVKGVAFMHKRILAAGMILTVMLTTGLAKAAQTNYSIGQSAGAELKINLSTRFAGTADAGIALVDDLSATALNPAGLSKVEGLQAGFMHNIYLEDTALDYLSYAQNLFPGAGLGANIMVLNFGQMDKVTVDSNNLPVLEDSFTPLSYAAKVGYGQQVMKALAVGAVLKLYGLSIDSNNYSSVAIDLGAQYKIMEGLNSAVTVENLGTSVADSSLSMLAKAGLAYAIPFKITANDQWNVMLDVILPFGDTNYTSANIGTEYWYNQTLALRLGYKAKDTGGLEGLNGLTAGLGGKLKMGTMALTVDYALTTFGDLGLSHQIAVGVAF